MEIDKAEIRKIIRDESRTDDDIRLIARSEIQECLNGLTSDIKEIKLALLGDDKYNHIGLIRMVQDNTDYISKNKTLKIAERGEEALEWFDRWSDKDDNGLSMFNKIEEIIRTYGYWKWLFGLLGISSLYSLIALVEKIVNFLTD